MIRNKVAQYFDSHDIDIPKAYYLTGIPRSSIVRLYRNEVVNINLDTIDTLCNALGCKISDLFEFVPNSKMTDQDERELYERKLRVKYYSQLRRKKRMDETNG